MSSRNHTPGISQSPRDIGKRSLRGVLGQHQQRTADIRDVLYIKPLGKIQHLVRNIGTNTQAYRVGSNLPGITFRPGEIVQVASNTGHPGENIISVAPPGKKGSTPSFQGSSSLTLPTPTLTNACALSMTGLSYTGIGRKAGGGFTTFVAYEFSDATIGTLLAETTIPTAVTDGDISRTAVAIPTDPGGNVADNSVAWLSEGDADIAVWDIGNNLTYQWTGTNEAFGPLWDGTHLWWVHLDTSNNGSGGNARLRRANADLTSVTLISTTAFASGFVFDAVGMIDGYVIVYPDISSTPSGRLGYIPTDGTSGTIPGSQSHNQAGTGNGAYTSAGSMRWAGVEASPLLVSSIASDETLFFPTEDTTVNLIDDGSKALVGAKSTPDGRYVISSRIGNPTGGIPPRHILRIDATADYSVCTELSGMVEMNSSYSEFTSGLPGCLLPRS